MATDHAMRRNCLLDAAFRGIILRDELTSTFATIEYNHRKQNRAVARPTVIRHWRLETMPKRNCTPESGEAQCLVHTTTNEVPPKRCTMCGEEKPPTYEYFHRNQAAPDGLEYRCKVCRKEIEHQRYIKKLEQGFERPKYDRRNRNRTVELIGWQRREAQKRNLPATFTHEQWQRCLVYWENACAYCGITRDLFSKLYQDHFTPKSQGGGYTADNIVPACKSCNSSKLNATAAHWLPYRIGVERATESLARIEAYFAYIKSLAVDDE